MEGATAKLRCELSKAAPVEWRKGPETLRAGHRVSLRQDGAVCELEIRELTVEDAGEYSCVCGQERTSATLAVRGKDCVWPRGWRLAAALRLCSQSPFCSALSLSCFFSCHDYSVLPVMSRVCSMAHAPLGLLKPQSQRVLPSPSPAGFCVFGVLSTSCCFCVFKECDSVCVFLTPSSPACQVHKRPEEGRGRGRGHSQAAL